jgi:hypothetical protein
MAKKKKAVKKSAAKSEKKVAVRKKAPKKAAPVKPTPVPAPVPVPVPAPPAPTPVAPPKKVERKENTFKCVRCGNERYKSNVVVSIDEGLVCGGCQ